MEIFRDYVRENPDVPPDMRRLIINVKALVGVNVPPEKFRWLREKYEPAGQVVYCRFVFIVPEAA